jgi:hypothetical protein
MYFQISASPCHRTECALGLLLLISYSLLSNVKIVRDASRSLSAYTNANNDKLSHLPPQSHLPPPRVDKQQQQQQRQGSENNNLRAPKNVVRIHIRVREIISYAFIGHSSLLHVPQHYVEHLIINIAHLLYCSKSLLLHVL